MLSKHWLAGLATVRGDPAVRGPAPPSPRIPFQLEHDGRSGRALHRGAVGSDGNRSAEFLSRLRVGVSGCWRRRTRRKRIGRLFCIPDTARRRATRRSPTSCNGPRPARMDGAAAGRRNDRLPGARNIPARAASEAEEATDEAHMHDPAGLLHRPDGMLGPERHAATRLDRHRHRRGGGAVLGAIGGNAGLGAGRRRRVPASPAA